MYDKIICIDVFLSPPKDLPPMEKSLKICPPGPDDLMKVSLISFSLMEIAGVMEIIRAGYIKSIASSRTRTESAEKWILSFSEDDGLTSDRRF